MAVEVELPDGTIAEFPDGTPREVMQKALARYATPAVAPQPEKPAGPGVLEDVAKSAGSGLVKGVLGLGSMPGNIEQLGRMGIDYGAKKLGLDDPEASKGQWLPNYGDYKADLERRLGMKLYDPKTTAGEYAGTAASFAAGAGSMPGTLTQKVIGGVAGPAIASETAGQMSKGTSLEPWARMGAALLGAKAAPILADGVAAVGRGAGAPIRAAYNPQGVAAEKVGEALARDLTRPGTTPTAADIATRAGDRLQSMSDGNRSVRLADVGGENTQGLLRASANMPNEARQGVKRMLDDRQANQWARIEGAADKGLAPGRRMEQTVDDLIAARDAAAAPMFAQAFATPTPLTPRLTGVLSRPGIQEIVRRVAIKLENEGKQLAPSNNTEWLHRVKLELDDLIGQSKMAEKMGNTPQAGFDTRTLVTLKNDMLNAISHPTYKRALKDYAGPSALKTAAERGESEFMKASAYEIRSALKAMTPAEQEMYRLGAKQAMFTRMEGPNVTRDLTDGMFGSAGIQARLGALFPDRKQLREFQKALITEAKMADTRKAAQGNSTTPKQLAEGGEAAKNATMVKSGVNAVTGIATGRLQPAMDFLGQTYNRFSGLSPKVAAEVMRLQMSKNFASALRSVQSGMNRATATPIRRPGYGDGLMGGYQTLPGGGLLDMSYPPGDPRNRY